MIDCSRLYRTAFPAPNISSFYSEVLSELFLGEFPTLAVVFDRLTKMICTQEAPPGS